jgi:hypothetical protein
MPGMARAQKLPGHLDSICSVEDISLTPRFNAVNHDQAREKPFKRFFASRTVHTRLKPGVNDDFSPKQTQF